MQISTLLIGTALLVASAYFVSRPFLEKNKKGVKATASGVESGQREAVLAALRDLDFDFKTGKISDEDYQPLRTQLLIQAAQHMELDKKDDEQLEALIQSRRKLQSKQASCPSCGKKIVVGDSFCSSCGARLEIRVEVVSQS
jgi:hypothetical protein